jgi:hypothetical protein
MKAEKYGVAGLQQFAEVTPIHATKAMDDRTITRMQVAQQLLSGLVRCRG